MLSGTIGAHKLPAGYDKDDVSPAGDIEDEVEQQIQQERSEWDGDGSDEIEA